MAKRPRQDVESLAHAGDIRDATQTRATLGTSESNPRASVSYAWKDEHSKRPEVHGVVGKLCNRLCAAGIHVLRDTTNIRPGDRVSSFMQMMADVDLVIVVLSDAYLRSPNCMYELLQIWNCRNDDPDRFFRRIRILPLPGTKIFSMRDRVAYATFWKNQRDEIAIVIDENGIDLLGPSELNHLKNTSNIAAMITDSANRGVDGGGCTVF